MRPDVVFIEFPMPRIHPLFLPEEHLKLSASPLIVIDSEHLREPVFSPEAQLIQQVLLESSSAPALNRHERRKQKAFERQGR